ncbi:hypothetical protein R6Q59_035538 [Mikania micrantha]
MAILDFQTNRTNPKQQWENLPHLIYSIIWDPNVSLEINYDLPNNRELYIYRVGRSGRFGLKRVGFYKQRVLRK